MITKNRLEKSNAIAKAEELEPAVVFTSIGEYHVFTEDDVHIVIIEQNRRGYCEITCDCRAAKYKNACFHAAAALTAHIKACSEQGVAVENIKPPTRSGNQAANPLWQPSRQPEPAGSESPLGAGQRALYKSGLETKTINGWKHAGLADRINAGSFG